jgi:hypothetical protein
VKEYAFPLQFLKNSHYFLNYYLIKKSIPHFSTFTVLLFLLFTFIYFNREFPLHFFSFYSLSFSPFVPTLLLSSLRQFLLDAFLFSHYLDPSFFFFFLNPGNFTLFI